MKKELFWGDCYHIFNRGVEKRKVFCDKYDYKRFIDSMKEFNNHEVGSLRDRLDSKFSTGPTSALVQPVEEEKLVEIVAYCLNANHYHLILKEVSEDGIAKFIQKIATGYTRYFNEKYKRTGGLFQGRYKRVEVESNPQLLYLSAYVNGNHYIHKIKELESWEFSSLPEYLKNKKNGFCFKNDILGQFNNSGEDYLKFCKKNCDDIKEKRAFSKFLLEE